MPLQKQVVEIPFTGGMFTKAPTEAADPSSALRQITGYRFGKLGRLQRVGSVQNGYPNSGIGGNLPVAGQRLRTLARRGSDVFGVSDNYGVARVPNAPDAALRWVYQRTPNGTAVSEDLVYVPMQCEVKRRRGIAGRAPEDVGYSSAHVVALSTTLVIAAWVESRTGSGSSRLYMAAYDPTTGEMVSDAVEYVDSTTLATEMVVNVTKTSSTEAIITWSTGTSAPYTINGLSYTASSRAFSAVTALTTNAKTTAHGVGPGLDPGEFTLGFTDNTTGFLNVLSRTLSVVSFTHFSTTHGADRDVDIFQYGANIAIVSCTASTVYLEYLGTPGTTKTKSAVTLDTGASFRAITGCATSDTAGPILIVVEASHNFGRVIYHFESDGPAGGAFVSAGFHYNCRLFSKAFQQGYFGCYLAQLHNEGDLTSVVLVRAYTANRITAHARLFHEVSVARDSSFVAHAMSVGVIGSTLFAMSACGLEESQGFGRHGESVKLCEVAMMDDTLPMPWVEDRGTTVLCSGMPWYYDGTFASECAPLRRPQEPDITTQAGTTTAAFAVCAVYSWIDAQGMLHRSAPSDAVTVNASGVQVNVSIDFPPFFTHEWIGEPNLNLELYATEDGGSLFYLAAYASVSTSNAGKLVFQDVDPGDPSATPLYTDGGELPADPPPALVNIVRVQDRLVGLDAEDRTLVRFSKPLVEGFAPEWSSFNTVMIGDEGVGVFEHAGEIAVLCRNGVWKVSGVGPNANGQGTFAPPYRVPVELEGVSAQSIVQTPLGTMFLARHGVMLMSTAGELQLVGLPVQQELNADAITVKRASYWPRANEVRFLVRDISNEWMESWLYNVVEGKWSVDEVEDRLQGGGAFDDEVVSGDWCYASNEEPEVVRFAGDDLLAVSPHNRITGAFVLDTFYFKPDGLTGRGRVWWVDIGFRCEDSAATTAINMQLYDLQDGETGLRISDHRFSSGDLSWGANEVHWVRLYPKVQRVAGIRAQITVTDSSTARRGVVPLAMRIHYGIEPNAARQQAEQRGPFVAS